MGELHKHEHRVVQELDRREFVRIAAVGAAAAAIVGTAEGAMPVTQTSTRADFDELTIAKIRDGVDADKWSFQDVTGEYLRRTEALNLKGPALRAVIEVNPDALETATSRDEAPTNKPRPMLYGIPILVKDNVDTHDRMTTTAGSFALEGLRPAKDATVVAKLRAAGAIILGKANLSEWANFRSSLSTSGWSARGGQGRNPYVLDRSPLGSSSGCGTATAANMCAVSIGTETDGSIVAPAAVSCLVGLKPTVGLVSRAGIIPISPTQDTAGPICRTVADAAAVLTVIAGPDPSDGATAEAGKYATDYTKCLNAAALKGARIGVARRLCGFHRSADRVLEEALAVMSKQGAVIVELPEFFNAGIVGDTEMDVLIYEFKASLNKYLASQSAPYQALTLEKLIEFNVANRAREMPIFGQEIFLHSQACGPLTDEKYLKALAYNQLKTRAEGIDAVMDKNLLQAIVAPTCAPAGVIDQVNGDKYLGSTSTPAAVAGYPHITVPGGWEGELPIGMSFFGKAWSEPTLIALAYAFEQATQHRRAPKFIPTLAMR